MRRSIEKLTTTQLEEIRSKFDSGTSAFNLAVEYKRSPAQIYNIIKKADKLTTYQLEDLTISVKTDSLIGRELLEYVKNKPISLIFDIIKSAIRPVKESSTSQVIQPTNEPIVESSSKPIDKSPTGLFDDIDIS